MKGSAYPFHSPVSPSLPLPCVTICQPLAPTPTQSRALGVMLRLIYLRPYNRKGDYIYNLAHYMFAARCWAEEVHQFTKFLHLVATTDWSLYPSHGPIRIARRVRCSCSADNCCIHSCIRMRTAAASHP